MDPTRQVYWNIGNHYYMYVLLFLATIIFIWGFYQRYSLWVIGKKDNRFDNLLQRLSLLLKHVFFHIRLLRYPYSGIFHYLIFGSFVILFLGTVIVFFQADLGFNIMKGSLYLYFQSLVLDITGLFALIGIILAAVQRFIMKPNRYSTTNADIFILGGIFLVLVTGFLIEGIRVFITSDPWANWSPVGQLIANFFYLNKISGKLLQTLHNYFWWFHLIIVLALFSYIPYSKLSHVFLSPLNIYFRSLDPKGITVKPIDLEKDENLGVQNFSDFTWKQLFDLDACTECGRCQDNCPVYITGKPFSPRDLILNLRYYSQNYKAGKKVNEQQISKPIVGNAINQESLWYCRTCRACMEECPIFVEHISKLIELRRFQVMEEVEFPETLQEAIKSLESRGHPYRGTMASRTDWFKDLDIEEIDEQTRVKVLYWVGCTSALNEDIMKIARNFSLLLKEAKINFAVLGQKEICCGEPARRIGNEYLFENLARQNIDMLKSLNFDVIVTNCPHCYNVLKYEYQQFGGNFTVYHHSEFLFKLINEKKLKTENKIKEKITYHDPCYLGRYNEIFEIPRNLIETVLQWPISEMERAKERSFCCGGGGGGAWMTEEGKRINVTRAEQALSTGATVLATACPFCMMMMQDGVKTVDDNESMKVMDIAQILKEGINSKGNGG